MKFAVSFLVGVFALNSVSWGGASYIAAVGDVGDEDPCCYLRIAQITGLPNDPCVSQIEINITDEFTSVNDLAFLNSDGCCDPQIAVLGNCSVYVPYEESPWWGNDHIIQGKIVIYQVDPCDPLGVDYVASVTYLETFETTWSTVNDGTISPQPGQSYQIAALPSGGFIVECNAMCRICSTGGCIDDPFRSYNRLLFFDNEFTLRFMADGPTPYLTDRDIAGLAASSTDRFVWTYKGSAGGPGKVYRYLIDWDASQIVHEAVLHGGPSGCYYPAQLAPLVADPCHIVGGGFVVRNDTAAAFNAPHDFANGIMFDSSQGWGYYWPSDIDEVLGINSDDGNMYVILRRNDTDYELYTTDSLDGNYTDLGFSFSWAGAVLDDFRSDGDAILSSAECAVIADVTGDCDVDLFDFTVLTAAWNSTPIDSGWNQDCDISQPADDIINILDLVVFSSDWLSGRY